MGKIGGCPLLVTWQDWELVGRGEVEKIEECPLLDTSLRSSRKASANWIAVRLETGRNGCETIEL